jgi:hypothetical protein
MKQNVGRLDQYIRYGIAVGLVVTAIVTGLWWVALIAIIPALTAYRQTCPIYVPFKISTNKTEVKK